MLYLGLCKKKQAVSNLLRHLSSGQKMPATAHLVVAVAYWCIGGADGPTNGLTHFIKKCDDTAKKFGRAVNRTSHPTNA